MASENENSTDPRVHGEHIQRQLNELIQHARADIGRVSDIRFQALLETSAEVLTGLKTAYQHFASKAEPVWKNQVPVVPVMVPGPVLTPKAEAKAANKLPRADQLNKFEKSLEAHDSGNQPA